MNTRRAPRTCTSTRTPDRPPRNVQRGLPFAPARTSKKNKNPFATKYNSSATGTFPEIIGESGLGQSILFEEKDRGSR